MEKLMTRENLARFAYVNEAVCQKPVRGIVLSFFGLNGNLMFKEDTPEGKYFGQQGILYVVPYYNPWCWMDRQASAYTDEVLDVLFSAYDLSADTPVISTGGSMGGLSSLTYMVYARRTPVGCVSNCPVCDLVYHYTERPDMPRTIYSAFWNEEGTLAEVLPRFSPAHLVDEMPDSEYVIYHCTADKSVNKEKHSDPFVNRMRRAHRIRYIPVPGRGHCDLPADVRADFMAQPVRMIEKFWAGKGK